MSKNRYFIISFFLLILFNVGCSRKGPPAQVITDKTPSPYHFVKRGESISSIAQKHGMSRNSIIRINKLKPPYKLVVGQRIIVIPYDDSEESELKNDSLIKTADDIEIIDHPENENDSLLKDGDKSKIDESSKKSLYPASKTNIINKKISSKGFSWPVEGMVIKGFSKKNPGINIRAPKGTKVVSARDGTVVHSGVVRGFGNTILIKHNNSYLSVYSHLDKIKASDGKSIKRGEVIGTVGNTGKETKDSPPTLHFEIRKNTKPEDPRKYLPKG